MVKLTLTLFLVAAAVFNMVAAVTEEEREAFLQVVEPIVAECAAEYSVNFKLIEYIKEVRNADAINPCFIACLLKNAEALNSKGYFDAEKSLEGLRSFVSDDDEFAQFTNVFNRCSSVNDFPVADGARGCDRAKLVAECAFENFDEMPIY